MEENEDKQRMSEENRKEGSEGKTRVEVARGKQNTKNPTNPKQNAEQPN